MLKKVFIAIIVSMSLISFTALPVSAKTLSNSFKKQQSIDENFIYTYAFNLLVAFENQADGAQDEEGKQFLRNYFKDEAKLSDRHYEDLKTIAYNFVSAYHTSSKRQRLQLVSSYKNLLKMVLDDNEFYRFDAFIKTRIAPSITLIKLGPVNFYGSTSISVNQTTHQLTGAAGIGFNDSLNSPNSTPCSASASMTGANVSVSGSDSADCDQRSAGVTLVSTAYQDNSQYCITGSFSVSGQSLPSSTSCLTTPGVPRVTSLNYEQIDATDLPIDVNPNAGGGLRIFADRKDTTDQIDRRKIRVRAKYGMQASGVRIYFRNFDPDDPSANSAPIDPETRANAGDDTNGNVDGTASTKAGLLWFPQGSSGCQTFPKGVSCLTDANGEAVADFTVTQQPGDNFVVAASPDQDYLTNLTLAADGINLKDASDVQVPVTTRTANACLTSTVNSCRADMLTVWRRLHLEVDSMGNVTNNSVAGTFASSITIARNATVTVSVNSPQLDINRFQDGRVFLNGFSEPPLNIVANSATTIDIYNPSKSVSITNGQNFLLYDDDDFNSNDGTARRPKHGDEGEHIPLLNQDFLKDNDTFPVDITTPDSNALAPAYIRPKYDLTGSGEDTTFFANISADSGSAVRSVFKFDNAASNARTDFWTAYVLSGYQYTSDADGDPIDETTIALNLKVGITDEQHGQGSIVFYESLSPHECFGTAIDCSIALTKVHEVGHLLNANHNQGGIMDNLLVNFSDVSLNEIRKNLRP